MYTDPSGHFIPLVLWGAAALYKAYNVYDTVDTSVDNFNTVTDPNASTGEKALALVDSVSALAGVPKFARKATGKLGSTFKSKNNKSTGNNASTAGKSEQPKSSGSDRNTDKKAESEEEINIDTGSAVSLVSQDSPERHQVKGLVKDKQMVMTKTAEKEFDNIIENIAGAKEKARAARLKKKIKIIDDDPSERARNLKVTKKVGEADKIIFGTGDKRNITTITADGKFVRGAKAQGVDFDVKTHDPVPLKGQ